MMRARLTPTPLAGLVAAAALALTACLGGTGTDTENGLTVSNVSGAPMAQVQVRVYPAASTPDAPGADPVVGGSANLVTDSAGVVRFQLTAPGKYLVEGRRGDTVLFIDTLRPAGTLHQRVVTETPVRLQGSVRLLSGFAADTGLLFLRGTGMASPIDGEGRYDFGWGPAKALARLTVGVRYGARPVAHTFVKMAARETAGLFGSMHPWASHHEDAAPADSLTLFKALKSQNTVCLEDSAVAVVPAYSVAGSLKSEAVVIREVGVACQGRSGALIQAQAVDGLGRPIEVLDEFVLPDTLAWGESKLAKFLGGVGSNAPLSQRAIASSCILPSKDATYRATVAGSEVRIDDIRRGDDCIPEFPEE